jgi:hypothetical protein
VEAMGVSFFGTRRRRQGCGVVTQAWEEETVRLISPEESEKGRDRA